MDIRKAFLDYFKERSHQIVASSPLVPEDPTLLFTNAGMVQFKPIFTGEVPIPAIPRAASSQTCIRAGGKHNDLENVGFTARHHTFFEMLGNFSFGDYFKEEAIGYAWEFVTDVLGLEKERLWVSVHESDDEAEAIWSKYVSKERIKRMGDKDNFWQMGDTGPCGPCSEIYYDQGAEHFHGPEDYFGGDGDRFLEIWNLVFMQYNRTADGVLHPLPKPSIDTGMGLERITAIKEGQLSNYDTSLFMPLIRKLEEITQKPYEYATGASYRVVADHLRAVSFLLAQGVNFDKEGRGYVMRRILRRAVRHGYLLGLREPFIYRMVETLVGIMGESYPYLRERQGHIEEMMRLEEERFFATIAAGMELFDKEMRSEPALFSGEVAFKLYDTYGFPLDLTEDMLRGTSTRIDYERFEQLMQEQRERAKAAWKGSGDAAVSGDFRKVAEEVGENRFVGYETTMVSTTVLALLDDEFRLTDKLAAGSRGWVYLKETPFYAESGGQIGDSGALVGVGKIETTKKFLGMNFSRLLVDHEVCVGDVVVAVVDANRHDIARHHSATHLLHAALRQVLGTHVAQAGSQVESDRLRFDFSHPKAMSSEEIAHVEALVNRWIGQAIEGEVMEMSFDEAKAAGAMALFGEKYGDRVRVVKFGNASTELCGGTHVTNTAHIGAFIITKESGVSAGVRRIEAVVGQAAVELMRQMRRELDEAKEAVKNRDLLAGIIKLKEEIKTLKQELTKAKKGIKAELPVTIINDAALIVAEVRVGEIKELVDETKNRYEKIAVLLVQPSEEKVMIACGVKNLPLKAGAWLREVAAVLGGKGGGRDDFASGAGKDPAQIPAALRKAEEIARESIGG
ncbi:MAG: alanine--tRNA ligase [Campylobacterales bacterium]